VPFRRNPVIPAGIHGALKSTAIMIGLTSGKACYLSQCESATLPMQGVIFDISYHFMLWHYTYMRSIQSLIISKDDMEEVWKILYFVGTT